MKGKMSKAKIIHGIRELKNSHDDAKRVNKTKHKEYMAVYDELVTEIIVIEKQIPCILEDLKNENLEVRYLRGDRTDPGDVGLRYLFESGIKPGRLYLEKPAVKPKDLETEYDICYVNHDGRVVRRVYQGCDVPTETLIIYNVNKRVDVTYEINGVVTDYQKTVFDPKTNTITIKHLELYTRKQRYYELWKYKRVGYHAISVDTYVFQDFKLVECNLATCMPFGITTLLIPKKPERITWNISESVITINRDDCGTPIGYTNDWVDTSLLMEKDIEEHELAKAKSAKIQSVEKIIKDKSLFIKQ